MVPKLDIIYNNIRINQNLRVTYLDCILDKTLSGEFIAHKVIGKVKARLTFLYQKNKFLTKNLHHLLCLNRASFLLYLLSAVP